MDNVVGLQVGEAARVLGLSEQRVRVLLAQGALTGQKVAGRWFVSPESIERARLRRNVRGRQLSASNAWAFLLVASGEEPDWLSPWDYSRLGQRIESDWEKWIPRLGNRARAVRMRLHPGSLKKLRSDGRLLLSGISAARKHGQDVIASDEVEGYVRERDLSRLVRDYKLDDSSRPNVTLHVVAGDWVFRSHHDVAPPAVVAVDLIESDNPRSRRAGEALLRRLNKGRPT